MQKIDPNAPVTYKVFRKTLTEELTAAVEETVEKVGEMMEEGFTEVKQELKSAASDRLEIKRQINDLKADTPTRKEVDGLDKRVTRLESFHSH